MGKVARCRRGGDAIGVPYSGEIGKRVVGLSEVGDAVGDLGYGFVVVEVGSGGWCDWLDWSGLPVVLGCEPAPEVFGGFAQGLCAPWGLGEDDDVRLGGRVGGYDAEFGFACALADFDVGSVGGVVGIDDGGPTWVGVGGRMVVLWLVVGVVVSGSAYCGDRVFCAVGGGSDGGLLGGVFGVGVLLFSHVVVAVGVWLWVLVGVGFVALVVGDLDWAGALVEFEGFLEEVSAGD